MAALRPLIYNLHRLIARCSSPTPTGVDRVDFQHASFLLQLADKEQRQILFIRQLGEIAYPIPLPLARKIIQNLEQRWQQGQQLPPAIKTGKLDYLRRWPTAWLHKKQGRLLTPKLKQLISNAGKNPIYIHSGHGTLRYTALHQQIKQQCQADTLYYLHDLIPINFPEYTNNPQEKQIHEQRMQTMSQTGSLILANSNDSAQGFINYCEQNNLTTPRTATLLIGVEEHMIAAGKTNPIPLPENCSQLKNTSYFIVIGTIEPRKNHILLLHLWRQLAAELGEQCPKLVILGRRGWQISNLTHMLDRSPVLQQHIIEVNGTSDHDMISLIQHSKALLFPSFAEGWGMPLAESLTLGTPAICADIPALHECGRDNAIYLDPLDGPGWKQAILEHLKSDVPRHKAIGYQPDRWQDHLNQLAAYIHELDN